MLEYTVYSTGCPKCKVLIKKLDSIGAKYNVINDINELQKLGIKEVPMMSTFDGTNNSKLYNFKESIEIINNIYK